MKFLTNVDLNNNELQNILFQKLGTAPTGVEGKVYYDTTSKKFWGYNGTAWVDLSIAITGLQATSEKNQANGYCGLGSDGKVGAAQLPSYVDDVAEYSTLTGFPTTGETGKIYVATDTNLTYRWGGSAYVGISQSLALGETSSTAYRGDYGKIAYDHSQTAHAPSSAQKNSDITKAEIEAKLTGTISSHTHAANINKYSTTVGDGTNSSFVITHSLGSQDVFVTVREAASAYAVVYPDIEMTSSTTVTLRFTTAPAASQYKVIIVG